MTRGLVWKMVDKETKAKQHFETLKNGWTPKRDTWADDMQARIAKIFEIDPALLELVKDK